MKFLESAGSLIEGVDSEHGCLCEITEVEVDKGMESHKELPRDFASYCTYEVACNDHSQ